MSRSAGVVDLREDAFSGLGLTDRRPPFGVLQLEVLLDLLDTDLFFGREALKADGRARRPDNPDTVGFSVAWL